MTTATLPPQNMDAERGVLGSVLLESSGDALDIAIESVSPDHFYPNSGSAHGRIFQAMLDCREAGTPLDPVTVGLRLERNGVLEDVGGVDTLQELIAAVPHPAHVGYYSEIVSKCYRQRKFQQSLRELDRLAGLPDADLDALAVEAERLPGIASTGRADRFTLYSAAEFAGADFKREYLIPGILVRGEPCIVGAAQKGLKTSICAIDLSLSLATGSPFLGKFNVPKTVRVCVLSGESGLGTLQETARRVATSKGWALDQIPNWFISGEIPSMTDPADVRSLRKLIEQRRVDVLILDPAYLVMGVEGNDSANRFAMGKILRQLSELTAKTGVTIILIHHTNKPAAREFGKPPELTELSHAGFGEFARQWILIGRRAAYQHDGRHELAIAFGGSAGHSSLWAVDVEEGHWDDANGRRWDVAVMKPEEARTSARDSAEDEATSRDRDRIATAAQSFPAGETKSMIRDTSGVDSRRFNPIFAKLIQSGNLVPVSIPKANGRKYDGYKWQSDDSDSSRISGSPAGKSTHSDRGPVRPHPYPSACPPALGLYDGPSVSGSGGDF
jgi:replicative DNA helicase